MLLVLSGSCADNRLVHLHVERKQEHCQQTTDRSSAGNSPGKEHNCSSRHLYSPLPMFMTLPPQCISSVTYKQFCKRKSYTYICIYALKTVFSNEGESITEEIPLPADMKMTDHIYTVVPLPSTPFIF